MPRIGLPRGIRAKITIGVAGVITVALVASSIALLWALERNLRQQADDAISRQADDRAVLLANGADPVSLTFTRARESFVWIATTGGDVVARGGIDIVGIGPVEPGVVTSVDATYRESEEELETESVRVASRVAVTPSGQELVLIVGAEVQTSSSTLSITRRALVVSVPLVVIASAVAAWVGVGRTLRPVERIRSDAARISGDRMDQRVPVGDTGDEIDALAVTVNDMLDRLSAHDRRTRQFSADASHELKTPAANIKALLEVGTAEDWDDTRHAALTEADRLVHIVDDLLFVNTASDSVNPSRAVVHLDDVVFDEAELLQRRTGVRVDVSNVGPCDVVGDELSLRRVLRNLLDNAGRHAEHGVSVSTGVEDDVARLAVADDGPGIPAEHRELVFERFARLDADRSRAAGGTGLGLAIVREVVERHGGSVEVAATDVGATFVVTLPLS